MKLLTIALLTILLVLAFGYACQGKPPSHQNESPSEQVLVGQVLLPSGFGSRGVEVIVTLAETGSVSHDLWLLFDEEGRFTHSFPGSLISVKIMAGLGAEMHRIDTEDLPEANKAGRIELGAVDLRKKLTRHRLLVSPIDGDSSGVVRVAMCFGPPPTGPRGEPVSLGSRQFPSIALGDESEWLLPNDGQSIYFLVERPSGSGRGREWRSGQQQLFGPFTTAEVPAELRLNW